MVWLRRSGGAVRTLLHYRATSENAPHTHIGFAAVACSRCWAALCLKIFLSLTEDALRIDCQEVDFSADPRNEIA